MIVSHTPGSALERKRAARLDIARGLDQALVTQDPDRVITRCDRGGRMVARHDPRRDQSSKEDCLIVRPQNRSLGGSIGNDPSGLRLVG